MKYLSNSALTRLKNKLSGEDEPDPERFRTGALHDALITAPETVDFFARTVTHYKETLQYSQAEMKWGCEMRDAFYKDPVCAQIHASSNLQEEVKNEFVDFGDMTLACMCRCDFRLKAARWPVDLKKTSAKTLDEFKIAVDRFDYDRAAAFYMAVCQSDRFLFLAQRKVKPYEVMKLMVLRGDDIWQSGMNKTMDLIAKFDILQELL